MDGQADLFFQRLDQLVRGVGAAEARHVLDREEMRAHALQFLGDADVVFEREFVAPIVEYVPRSARLLKAMPALEKGHMVVPPGGGFGLELDPDAVARFTVTN